MSVKYKEFYKNTVEGNKTIFARFIEIHDKYSKDKDKFEHEFHEIGSEIMTILKKAEDKLCFQTENGRYGKFSSQLAEKFWEEIKKDFPLIDTVQVTSQAQDPVAVLDDLF